MTSAQSVTSESKGNFDDVKNGHHRNFILVNPVMLKLKLFTR